jgi:2-C-methyl-D-erythritol 4-phosphate cytidylyltransferase
VTVWTIVVAAGRGSRFGGPKQLEMLAGRRVMDWSVEVARAVSDGVVLVVPPGLSEPDAVPGGETRSASVRAGLAQVPADATVIVVHDAARPLATAELFGRVIEAVRAGADAALPGLAVSDTLKRVTGDAVVATVDRTDVVAVQTPQAFRASALRAAHASSPEATDDGAVIEAAGGKVVVVPGEPTNMKITTPADLIAAAALLTR